MNHMAHFAKIVNSTVEQVIVISDTYAPNPAPANSEPIGQAFIRDVLGLEGEWVQTSYNGTFRAHYAGIGYTWDAINQVFYPPQPYPSWYLDEDWNWQAPVPYPNDGNDYLWDEATQQWVLELISEDQP
jgi:hypothetical protein